ncbi:hypothetical protein [Sulfurovum sp.]|uniref:hypothetical protein n=1 Tax=Sulfurovum sp. TaxID=1969726 RepID=UPI0028681C69|nr:hypothetical protein [Sulfurovum sp.]
MNWKRYQNELIVLAAFLLMFSMYLYKQSAISSQSGERNKVTQTIEEVKEVVALKKVWADKKISQKVEKLKTIVPVSKVKWSNKSRKVTALYTSLKPSELNKLGSKILNTPVIIEKLDVQKTGSNYKVEFKCRW